MSNTSFYLEIMDLINSKTEGQYWDFKREPHKNKDLLLHDIICLANAKHNGDRYLIIGVSDPRENCEIIGLDKNTENRKDEANLNDFLNSKMFSGGNIPNINVRTLHVDDKEIDIIIIKNSLKKPFYLENSYESVKAYHIYTRTGDKNTSRDKNASFGDIEYMWKEHFGLHLNVEEKFRLYLNNIKDWKNEFYNKKIAIYKPDPNFSIELSELESSNHVEPFNTFYLDNSLFHGDILFKYGSNVIFQCEYAYCDGIRILIPIPKLCTYRDKDDERVYFYYYNLEEIEGQFAKLISNNKFDFRCRGHSFPFILVKNKNILNKFVEYLKKNLNKSDIIEDTYFNIGDPNDYNSSVDLKSLGYVESIFEEWKESYKY